MDETSVRINNGCNKTIVPVGTEGIIITRDKKEKRASHALAVVSVSKKLI